MSPPHDRERAASASPPTGASGAAARAPEPAQSPSLPYPTNPQDPSGDASRVLRGSCHLLFVYDIGQGIDLTRCAKDFSAWTQERRLRHTHHAPDWFQFQPPPLHVVQDTDSLAVGKWSTRPAVEVMLYDFGAVSVSYELPFAGTLEEWIELGCVLFESETLDRDGERRVRDLSTLLGSLVQKPGFASVSEDYALFVFGDLGEGESEPELLARHGADLARLLRSERSALSEQERSDALSNRVSFGERDLAIIDWNGALLFDDEPEDVRSVLEFANVQLLELRFLDRQLDLALDRAFETLGRRDWRHLLTPASFERDLERVSAMQVDAAILFERVGNALKLWNDQYLARVYRQASQRLRLAEWNTSLLRKLETLEGIYQKIQDRADARRMEFLEWIIIALILVSIVLPFLPWYGGH